MTVRTISVANQVQLVTALQASTGGETIVLAAGSYGDLALSRFQFTEQVTIKGGTFNSIALVGVKGLTFDDSTVNLPPTMTSNAGTQAIRVSNSSNIAITDAKITGGLAINGVAQDATILDASRNVIGLPAGVGIYVAFSKGVTISGSDISLFNKGILMAGSSEVNIANNEIHDLRTTPISGSVTANLTITGNHTYNSTPWSYGGAGDHGDRIHIWTDTTAISGVVITNNNLEQGTGAPMLGIYLDDNGKGLGFVNTVISGNRLTDGQGQGVLLENVSGTVSNNTLVWSGFGTVGNNTPRFDIKSGSHALVLDGNSGPVSIDAGAYDIRVTNQNGSVTLDSALTPEALATITSDYQVVTAQNNVTLAASFHDLIFRGTGNFTGIGNALNNKIVSGNGNDKLVGNGGADVLNGGNGNDSYYVDNLKQTIIDSSGIDIVYSSIGWKLQTGLENLIYTGTTGATLEANWASSRIVGGIGNDKLIGVGSQDTLEGGLGNDTYILDTATHRVIDTGGIDSVVVSATYALGSGLENLTLSGIGNLIATGNELRNVLRGNAGTNILDGKAGADTMYGGAGGDWYIVDNISDRCIEVENGVDAGGIDLVKASVGSYTLGAGIENLTFVGIGNFNGVGNDLNNVITGGSGINTLTGGGGRDTLIGGIMNDALNGGAGADTLSGGSGNDIFVLAKGQSNGDIITDFRGNGAAAGDSIKLIGWGAGTTVTQGTSSNLWEIRDGVDHSVEVVTIYTPVNVSDIMFG